MAVIDLMNGELASALTAIGAIVVKTTAVLLLGTAISMCARGASAATRHMIWTLTLAGGLAVPVVAALAPQWNVPVPRWVLPDRDLIFESTRISVTGEGSSSSADVPDAVPAAEAVSADEAAPARASVRPRATESAESETESVTTTTTV